LSAFTFLAARSYSSKGFTFYFVVVVVVVDVLVMIDVTLVTLRQIRPCFSIATVVTVTFYVILF
jgi:hypothetical protein